MADYRFWCHSCGNEIGFGGHKPGCAAVQAEQDAKRAKREWESELYEATKGYSDDELFEELKEGYEKIGYLDDELRATQKRYDYLRYALVSREGGHRLIERMRAEGMKI
jgi:hypothetical protein